MCLSGDVKCILVTHCMHVLEKNCTTVRDDRLAKPFVVSPCACSDIPMHVKNESSCGSDNITWPHRHRYVDKKRKCMLTVAEFRYLYDRIGSRRESTASCQLAS